MTIKEFVREQLMMLADKLTDTGSSKKTETAVVIPRRRRGTGSIYVRGDMYCADIRLGGVRHRRAFAHPKDAAKWLDELIAVHNEKTADQDMPLFTQETVVCGECKKEYRPLNNDELIGLTGRIIEKKPYRSMQIIATSYGKIFCGGVSMPFTSQRLLDEGWVFKDTGELVGMPVK